MKHEKYLLVLDTFAHSTKNTLYMIELPTVKAARAAVVDYLNHGWISFDYSSPRPVKIYCALLYKRVPRSKTCEVISRTGDGHRWRKYESIYGVIPEERINKNDLTRLMNDAEQTALSGAQEA